MGILNLGLFNIALLMRWWWQAYSDPQCLWSATLYNIKRIGNDPQKPNLWCAGGSFFWKQLQSLKNLFTWCTQWMIGDGRKISYWFDVWDEYPRAALNLVLEPNISLQEACPRLDAINPNESSLSLAQFSDGEDHISWKWDSHGVYTAKSAYQILCMGGKIKCAFMYVWAAKITPSAKIFAYLALRDRILTRERLRSRGMQTPRMCVCCSNCPVESLAHLLFLCPFAVEVWFHIATSLNRHIMKVAGTVTLIWQKSWEMVKSQGGMSKRDWVSRFVCTMWNIWKNRNCIIFRNQGLPATLLASRIMDEMRLWIVHC